MRRPVSAAHTATTSTVKGHSAIHGFHSWVPASSPYPPSSTAKVTATPAITAVPATRRTSHNAVVTQAAPRMATAASDAQAERPSTR